MPQSEWKNIPYAQKDVLVSLPVKVGVWMSHYDDQGDVKADDNEAEALTEIITYMADEKTSTTFVTDIFQETLKVKDRWQDWNCCDNAVMVDAKQAMQIVNDNVSKQDATAFREAMLTVCEVVAQAYGEFSSYDDADKSGGWLSSVKGALDKIKGRSYVKMDNPFNISPAEQAAINELRQALESGT